MPCQGPGDCKVRQAIWFNETRAAWLEMAQATNRSEWRDEIAKFGLATLIDFIKTHRSGRLGYTGPDGRFVANDLRYTAPTLNSYAYVDMDGKSSVVIVANVEDICAADVVFKKMTGKDAKSFAVYPLHGAGVKGYLTYCERRKKERK